MPYGDQKRLLVPYEPYRDKSTTQEWEMAE